jgi:Ca2+-binding RTX toxin-like protein
MAFIPSSEAGTLQFSSATYSAKENDGEVRITITRTNGADGEVSMDYTTAPGTATESADYTFTDGSLTFANGHAESQTFTVPIIDDTDVEGSETINLSLINPDGGATLSAPNTAVLTIVDNDEPAVTCAGLVTTIVGMAKSDILSGTSRRDMIQGLSGDDVIRGYGGEDVIYSCTGEDQLFGGSGDNQLFGGGGNDRLLGGRANDQLSGERGNDQLVGESANDSLHGGNNSHRCDGGPSARGAGHSLRTDQQRVLENF